MIGDQQSLERNGERGRERKSALSNREEKTLEKIPEASEEKKKQKTSKE